MVDLLLLVRLTTSGWQGGLCSLVINSAIGILCGTPGDSWQGMVRNSVKQLEVETGSVWIFERQHIVETGNGRELDEAFCGQKGYKSNRPRWCGDVTETITSTCRTDENLDLTEGLIGSRQWKVQKRHSWDGKWPRSFQVLASDSPPGSCRR